MSGRACEGELDVETTICHELRQSGTEVVIDHVSEDGTIAAIRPRPCTVFRASNCVGAAS